MLIIDCEGDPPTKVGVPAIIIEITKLDEEAVEKMMSDVKQRERGDLAARHVTRRVDIEWKFLQEFYQRSRTPR